MITFSFICKVLFFLELVTFSSPLTFCPLASLTTNSSQTVYIFLQDFQTHEAFYQFHLTLLYKLSISSDLDCLSPMPGTQLSATLGSLLTITLPLPLLISDFFYSTSTSLLVELIFWLFVRSYKAHKTFFLRSWIF